MKLKAILAIFGLTFSFAHAQPQLLEACNAVDDRAKRMTCLEELMRLQAVKPSQSNSSNTKSAALKRAKTAFAAIAGAVQTGVSYDNYKQLIVDPARELGVLKQEQLNLDSVVIDRLTDAVNAYNDAELVWRASIYNSQDGGIFGRILNPQRTGLVAIVNRYNLATTTVLFNPHLPIGSALPAIWREAESMTKLAFDTAEDIKPPQAAPVPSYVQANSSPEEASVEELARASGCNTHPVAAQTAKKDGFAEYLVYCSREKSVIYHCSSGACTVQ